MKQNGNNVFIAVNTKGLDGGHRDLLSWGCFSSKPSLSIFHCIKWTNEVWNRPLKPMNAKCAAASEAEQRAAWMRQAFCSQEQIKHQLTRKLESCMNLTRVVCSAVHNWWVSCSWPARHSLANMHVYDSSHAACDAFFYTHTRAVIFLIKVILFQTSMKEKSMTGM